MESSTKGAIAGKEAAYSDGVGLRCRVEVHRDARSANICRLVGARSASGSYAAIVSFLVG